MSSSLSPGTKLGRYEIRSQLGASGNSDVEYLSDGITESLINNLSQLPNLSVKARSTVFHYKGKEVTPQQVGSELDLKT